MKLRVILHENQVVSDNGSPFQSREYGDFLKQNGIQRVTPYHPAAKSQAERFVQTFKKFLKSSASEGTLNQSIQNFLLTYRNTQHVTTGTTHAKLFLQRELRTRLALVRPDISLQVTSNQAKMKSYYDRHTKLRELSPGDRVLPRDYLSKLKWRPGSVSERRAPSSYCIQLDDGRIWHRHIDDLLLGAPQKQSQVPQASSEPVVPWTDLSRACRDISSDFGDISNYFTSDSSPSAPPAVETSVNFPSGAANAAAADLRQAAGTSALPSNPGSQSTSPVLRRSSRTSRIPRRLITKI